VVNPVLIIWFWCKVMGFSVVGHGCGKLLYQGKDLIPLYRLRRRTDGKCPSCGRKLAIRPLRISFEETEGGIDNFQEIP
jgi:hypothetical protein